MLTGPLAFSSYNYWLSAQLRLTESAANQQPSFPVRLQLPSAATPVKLANPLRTAACAPDPRSEGKLIIHSRVLDQVPGRFGDESVQCE
jgi:hypothetical protein